MSIFFIVISAPNARFAASSSVPVVASSITRGLIFHETHQLSLHHPHTLSWPPLSTIAFHSRSVSSCVTVWTMKEKASLCLKIGGPFNPTHGVPNRVNRSEEQPSELQSLIRNSYAVFCLNITPNPINRGYAHSPTRLI